MSRLAVVSRAAPGRPSLLWRRAEGEALAEAADALRDFEAAAARLRELARLDVLPAGVRSAAATAARAGAVDVAAARAIVARVSRTRR